MKTNCGSSPDSFTASNLLNIEYLKCHHGVDKRIHCHQCETENRNFLNYLHDARNEPSNRIPIYRGCQAHGGCFSTGKCKEIVGYRDPIFPGER